MSEKKTPGGRVTFNFSDEPNKDKSEPRAVTKGRELARKGERLAEKMRGVTFNLKDEK